MNEFKRRKEEVGPPDGKDEKTRKLHTIYVLDSNPHHPDGRIGLEQLAEDPDPEVSAAARASLERDELPFDSNDPNDDGRDYPDGSD